MTLTLLSNNFELSIYCRNFPHSIPQYTYDASKCFGNLETSDKMLDFMELENCDSMFTIFDLQTQMLKIIVCFEIQFAHLKHLLG